MGELGRKEKSSKGGDWFDEIGLEGRGGGGGCCRCHHQREGGWGATNWLGPVLHALCFFLPRRFFFFFFSPAKAVRFAKRAEKSPLRCVGNGGGGYST